MTPTPPASTAALWARFRFSVVGALLSSPPPRGDLKAAIRSLAARTWTHPITGRDVRFSAVTIERWYYTARRGDDPVDVLRRAVRKDCGKVSLATPLADRLSLQYQQHPHWSYQLHYDNLAALVKAEPALGTLMTNAMSIPGAAVMYHTFEFNQPLDLKAKGQKLNPQDPRRHYVTPLDTNMPRQYSPPSPSYEVEFTHITSFTFLVDGNGAIHVRPFDPSTTFTTLELSTITGTTFPEPVEGP